MYRCRHCAVQVKGQVVTLSDWEDAGSRLGVNPAEGSDRRCARMGTNLGRHQIIMHLSSSRNRKIQLISHRVCTGISDPRERGFPTESPSRADA